MADSSLDALRQTIVTATQALCQTGVLSYSGHGNASVRLDDGEMLLTGVSNVTNIRAEHIARVSFDGRPIEGQLVSTSAEIVAMHAIVYRVRPDVKSVIHTHSPNVTSYALAHQPLPCRYEGLLRLGVADDIPVAAWGPRGSEASVRNIEVALRDHAGANAVLLANHGLLAWGEDAEAAARLIVAMEEAALMCRFAEPLGGAKPFPPGALDQVRQRIAQFAAAGDTR